MLLLSLFQLAQSYDPVEFKKFFVAGTFSGLELGRGSEETGGVTALWELFSG